MQQAALMQRAQQRAPQPEQSGGFKKPDPSTFVPPEHKDVVDRVVAAGMKIMYAPGMREELLNEIKRDVPVPQKLAEGAAGLLLTLDKQTEGGIPMPALFPAALLLLGEAADVLATSGQAVTQDDYNEAAQMMFVIMARKMGAKDEEIMGGMEQMVAGAGGAPGGAPQAAPQAPPQGMPPGAAPEEEMQVA